MGDSYIFDKETEINMDIKALIRNLRENIEREFYKYNEFSIEHTFKNIDSYINDEKYSDLEKAFYLILNQFPDDSQNYIVKPSEMVLVPDVYDMSGPGIEYEIDFALYGGIIDSPVKVAIECDGIRSHRQKHNNKDRRKDANLQAAGWIVFRFGSNEIHEELAKYEKDESYTSDFLNYVENIIENKSRLITPKSYVKAEFRSKLTGYKWGYVICCHCNKSQMGELNHKRHTCRSCGKKFQRDIAPDEKITYEHKGLLYFE